eukprot:CAMPEP_0172557026 /NCGR_PEP_ID=MMETSP1067-20121228/70984_1 /TAXON_ID=265564 ORGANISM="Thalassiosira punctigera, Strain Tpunct2005C2" /NCGR_SAMPLE_ID=MMETSP1067 /ASSEMBLY_ACC=CAM_ASM_000444 /LENGTH=33 /DNA_ID= /DNA_START= /DNA_END= /DNA_ORIENTATION=
MKHCAKKFLSWHGMFSDEFDRTSLVQIPYSPVK